MPGMEAFRFLYKKSKVRPRDRHRKHAETAYQRCRQRDGMRKDKACAGTRSLTSTTACKKKLACRSEAYKANCKQIEGALRCSTVAAGAILDLESLCIERVCGVCLHHRPTRGGKGTVIYTLRRFGRANLCHNMGATYLFDDRVRAAWQRTASRCWPAWPARQRAATRTRIAGSTRRP